MAHDRAPPHTVQFMRYMVKIYLDLSLHLQISIYIYVPQVQVHISNVAVKK